MISAFFEAFNIANALYLLLLTVNMVRHVDVLSDIVGHLYTYSVLVDLL